MLSICVTGHRPHKLFGYNIHAAAYDKIRYGLKKAIYDILLAHPEEKAVTVFSGMALGVDQIFVESMIDARKYYRTKNVDFKIIAAIPCHNYEGHWNTMAQKEYHKLLAACDEKVFITDFYTPKCLNDRNEYMVNHSDIILAVWDESTNSGTGRCVDYAKRQGKTIIRIPF